MDNILHRLLRPFQKKARKLRKRKLRKQLEQAYLERNTDVSGDVINFRDNISFNVDSDCRNSYEHFCYINPPMVGEMDQFIKYAEGKSSFLDIGALHGVFSLAFAAGNPERKVLAVDASPEAFSFFMKNIRKNPSLSITPVECALSDKNGTLNMHLDWQHAIAAGTNETSENTIAVDMKTGDELCQEHDFQPDIIKIDVEGHEIKVIRGLHKVISEHLPVIFLEVHPKYIAEEGESAEELAPFFKSLNYQLLSIEGNNTPWSDLTEIHSDERYILLPEQAIS